MSMIKLLRLDLKACAHTDDLRGKLRVILFSPGFSATFWIRIQDSLFRFHFLLLANLIRRINLGIHGIDVTPGAKIAGGLRIEHPNGIVIGGDVQIGNNCTLLHGVTIGALYVDRARENPGSPIIGSNVILYTNSIVVGDIRVGDNCIIYAQTFLNCDLPSNYVAKGTPATLKKII